jgi:hypothetical protein
MNLLNEILLNEMQSMSIPVPFTEHKVANLQMDLFYV